MSLKFHHIGVATKNIRKEFSIYAALNYDVVENGEFIDENQHIKGLFIKAEGQPQLELLENLDEQGPLNSYLKNKTKYYHIAYEVENIESAINDLQQKTRAIIVSPIKEAVFFKRVCFLMLPNMSLIELVELKD